MKNFITIIAVLFFALVNAQNIVFADANLKAKLLTSTGLNGVCYTGWSATGLLNGLKVDVNNDNEISQIEALAVTGIIVTSSNISSIGGLEYFVNLKYFDCVNNQLTTLNLNLFPELEYLFCSNNNLTSLNFINTPLLKIIRCAENNITSLDFLNLQFLIDVNCANNLLTTLDFSNNPVLLSFGCSFNNLISINIKNGYDNSVPFGIMSNDGWTNNPNLQFICADENELPWIINDMSYFYPNNTISINSYCTLTPGGTSYAIAGTNHYDQNNNGCDNNDISFLNLKLNFSDGTNTGSVFANDAVNYNILVNAGTHTITPQLENPNYFNVSPTATTVTFPATASPFNQNYCVTANGVHNDLEINLLPISNVRPGYQASYWLVYKNKGTAQQSGTISFNYDDTKLNYVNSDVAISSQSNNVLNWNFDDLQPFESRYFRFWFTANVANNNSGDLLNTGAIISGTTDETPNDNISSCVQTVTNSYDPNDKTCTEGATIANTKVGEFVHYVIRFENNGTANATNVIVEDIIDTTKYDISSLISLASSHGFVTKITNNKNVAFVFENINLPFSTINNANDGFVAFKIKTKSTLVAGDSFSNKASIFFDYNAPIVTNTATTTVVNPLKNQDFEFGASFTIAPNPTKNSTTISFSNSTQSPIIEVYNVLGKLITSCQVINNSNSWQLDTSKLSAGMYLVVLKEQGKVSIQNKLIVE